MKIFNASGRQQFWEGEKKSNWRTHNKCGTFINYLFYMWQLFGALDLIIQKHTRTNAQPQINHHYLFVVPFLMWFDFNFYSDWQPFSDFLSLSCSCLLLSLMTVVQLKLKMGVKIVTKKNIHYISERARLISVWASLTSSSSSHKYVYMVVFVCVCPCVFVYLFVCLFQSSWKWKVSMRDKQ